MKSRIRSQIGRWIAKAVLVWVAVDFGAYRAVLGAEEGRRLPPTTISQIQESVLAVQNQVQSLAVQYCYFKPAASSSTQATRRVDYARHNLAVKGPLRFRENVHFSKDIPPELDLNHTCQIFTGESLGLFLVHARHYEVSRKALSRGFPWKVRRDVFLDSTGFWPESDERSSDEQDDIAIHLRFVFTHPRYQLRPGASAVDEHPCYVVEIPDVDRIWLDPAIGYAIRQRETFSPLTGELLQRHVSSEFQEYGVSEDAGNVKLWFPTSIHFWYETDVTGDPQDQPCDLEMKIEKLELNRVDDRLFTFIPPPGTLVLDRDSDESWQVPGGRDLLDSSVALAKALGGKRKAKPSSHLNDTPTEVILAVVVLVALTTINIGKVVR